jgi:tetratricopeptide (TPR) repeat protein
LNPEASSAALGMAQARQTDASGDEPSLSQGLDPVAEAQQKALTILAGLLFESPEDEQLRRGSQPAALRAMTLPSVGSSRQADYGRILLHLGQLIDFQTNRQYAEAVEELRQAVAAGLQEPAAYFDLGYLESQNEHWEAALQALEQAMKSPDFTLSSRLLMAMALYEMGQLKQASILCLEALRLADASTVPADQSEDLLQLYDAVIEAYSQVPEAETDGQVVENIAGMLMSKEWRQNLQRARQQLPAQPSGSPAAPLAEMFIQSRSNQVVESLAIINRLARAGNLEAAMDEAYYALLFAPTYLPLHSYMGELLLKQDRLPEAVAKLLIVARTYSIRGESARAIHLYRRVIELAPMELAARSCLIDQLLGLGRKEEVAAEYLAFAHVYYDMADLDMARKVLADALRFAQQSRLDLECRVKILHSMADIDLQSLDWRQAVKIFEQVLLLKPGDEKARAKLVELNFRLGQEAQAQAALDQTITYLVNAGQRAKAVKFLEDLLSEGLDRPVIHQRLAELRSRK